MQELKALLPVLALTLSLTGAKAITFTSNTALGVGNTNYDGQEITVSGCTLTVDGPHAFTSLLVTNGGAVTHSPAPNGEANNRLDLTIAGDVTVDATSAISVNGRGYGSASGPGAGGGDYWSAGGAGYGGRGGNGGGGLGGSAYGSLLQPVDPGSGGGYTANAGDGQPGGAGGGTIQMNVAGTLRVDGQVTGNGNGGTPTGHYSGGGSGGSLWLAVGTLTGTGSIFANGGQGFATAGGGGGGRIAVYYGTNTLSGSIAAQGGSGNVRGGAGTVYLKAAAQARGDVLIDNGGTGGAYTPLTTPTPYNLTIANHAYVYPTAALSVGNLLVASNGILFQLSGQVGLNLTVLGDASVAAGGTLSANGAGYGSTTGPGAGGGDYWSAGGAGYGGRGGNGGGGGGGSAYGSLLQPVDPGSGGGYTANAGDGQPGGAGGGTIQMNVAGTLRVDGQVTGNGNGGTPTGHYSGGGSGGSLWLAVGTLTGTGSIFANGGQGFATAGGGGGGRIAVYYGTNTLSGSIAAQGGSGNVRGGAGTVYLKAAAQARGDVLIDNGGTGGAYTPLTTPTPYNLTIANHAYVYPTAALSVGNLLVASNGILFQLSGQVGLNLTVLGDASVAAGGTLSANGAGYGSDSGPGAGGNYGNYAGYFSSGGAGYGGRGGNGDGGWGGSPYGSLLQPVDPGSGGAYSSNPWDGILGGAGGGTIRMNVAGAFRVDGQVVASGLSGTSAGHYSGGGSGGSVWLTVGTLAGAGVISANGGLGFQLGGGGGGGRIAIYQHGGSESVTASITATGGAGYQWGQDGTIYLSTNMLPLEVSSFAPTGTLRQAVSSVDVAFNQAVRSETFTPEDVLITAPSGQTPTGDITVTPLSAASFRIGFGSQAAVGNYQVQVGPHIENLYGQEMAAAYVGSFAITNPVVAGFVKRAGGVPLANVLLSASGGLATRTDTNGAYVLTMPPGWTGTVTPTNAGWVFTPGSLSYVSLTADATNENFTASLAEPLVLTTTRSANSLQFRWPSALGLEYQLQSATNLPVTTWLDEGAPFPGTGGVMSTNLSLGPEPKRFFRLQIEN